MSQTVADHLLSRLRDWGVQQVFGYPGDGINGLLAAWERADDDPQFVQARHEEMAAFEAVGFAKFSGEFGGVRRDQRPGRDTPAQRPVRRQARPRPGGGHRRADRPRSAMGGSYQQEIDLLSLFKDVCSDYVQMCTVPAAAAQPDRPGDPDRAVRARTHLHHLPSDVFELTYEPPGHAFKQVPSSLGWRGARRARRRARSARPPTCSTPASKVAMLVGQGARGCAAELTEVADLLGAGAAKALLGKDVLPDDLPWVTGSIGLLGHHRQLPPDDGLRHPAHRRLQLPLHPVPARRSTRPARCRSTAPASGSACATPTRSTWSATPRATLQALIPLLQRKADRSWREQIESERRRLVGRPWSASAMTDADPVNPMRIFSELSAAAARRTPSSPPTPAAPPTGTPAT